MNYYIIATTFVILLLISIIVLKKIKSYEKNLKIQVSKLTKFINYNNELEKNISLKFKILEQEYLKIEKDLILAIYDYKYNINEIRLDELLRELDQKLSFGIDIYNKIYDEKVIMFFKKYENIYLLREEKKRNLRLNVELINYLILEINGSPILEEYLYSFLNPNLRYINIRDINKLFMEFFKRKKSKISSKILGLILILLTLNSVSLQQVKKSDKNIKNDKEAKYKIIINNNIFPNEKLNEKEDSKRNIELKDNDVNLASNNTIGSNNNMEGNLIKTDKLGDLNISLGGKQNRQEQNQQIVFFEYGESELTIGAKQIIKEISRKLDKSTIVLLYGGTDTKGSNQYNNELKINRVENVRKEFIKNSINKDRIKHILEENYNNIIKTGPNIKEPLNRNVIIKLE